MTEGKKDRPTLEKAIDTILGRHVDENGLVEYLTKALEDHVRWYVEMLDGFDTDTLNTRNEKLAFWINAYNILVISGVYNAIKENPKFAEKGNKGMGSKFKFFMSTKYTVGNQKYSLLNIENDVIRKVFKEPRIHFALVCAALSCPKLRRSLYTADALDTELDEVTRDFINSPRGSVLDKEKSLITISKIFRMYRKDFGKSERDILDFVARFHDEGDVIAANIGSLKVKYMPYDWSPNIKD